MEKEKLIELINLAWEATESSKVGKIFEFNVDGVKLTNGAAFSVFQIILSSLVPKSITGDMGIKEQKEPWRE